MPDAPEPTEPRLIGFDHLDLFVGDRPAARKFFEAGLGMELMGDGPEHSFLLFGDVVLGLRDAPSAPSTRGVIDHLALRVSRLDGLRAWLQSRGLVPTGEKSRDGSRSLYLAGPEGITIELIERPEPHQHDCDSASVRHLGAAHPPRHA